MIEACPSVSSVCQKLEYYVDNMIKIRCLSLAKLIYLPQYVVAAVSRCPLGTTELTLRGNKPQSVYSAPVIIAAFHKINPGSVHAGVTEYIGKTYNVFINLVK